MEMISYYVLQIEHIEQLINDSLELIMINFVNAMNGILNSLAWYVWSTCFEYKYNTFDACVLL